MNRIFTLKYFAFLSLVLLGATTVQSQTTCDNTASCASATNTEDFNGDNGGGFSATPSAFVYSGTDFRVASSVKGTFYTLKSRNYALFASANSTTVGFSIPQTLNGFTGNYTINVRSASSGALLASCSSVYTSGAGTSNCITLTDANLQKTGGNLVYYEIVFNSSNGNGGNGRVLVVDDFKTNAGEAATLPVTFAGLQGMKTAKGTELTWKVGGEVNVARYDVERSTTGNGGFAKIGSIVATGSSRYTFTDATNFTGDVFYRIKNVDNDGRFKYSTMLQFRNSTSTIVFRVVPTLVTNKAVVQHPAPAGTTFISLTSTAGRTVRTIRPAAGAVETSIDMTGLQPGLYLLKWSDGSGSVKTAKVIKQ